MIMDEVETKVSKCELNCKEELSDELEERSKKSDARIVELELEIERRKKDNEELEANFRELESQHNFVELELKAFRTGNNEIRRHCNSVEDKNKVRFGRGKEEEGVVVDLEGEGDGENVINQLMIEISVLECEKRKAEKEVVHWKEKCKELELQVSQMKGGTVNSRKLLLDDIVDDESRPVVKSNIGQLLFNKKPVVCLGGTDGVPCKGINNSSASAGTPYKDSPCNHTPSVWNEGICSNLEGKCHRKVRRLLSFDEEKNAPTPGIGTPANFNLINISDSDDESDIHGTPLSISKYRENGKVGVLTEDAGAETSDAQKDEICLEDYEEDVNECSDKIPCVLTSKRKRGAKVVTSDTESDEDDNIPICELKKMHNQGMISAVANSDVNGCKVSSSPVNGSAQCAVTPSRRRRLVTLRQCEEKVKAERISSNILKEEQVIPTSYNVDDESEEAGSESEGESSDSFIDDRTDASEASGADNVPSHLESESDGNANFADILCKLQRSKSKDRKYKWEFEADMLSALGKDLELCMRAVCALYRQQTSDEQVNKETKYENSRGFSKFDALRGTNLAEFLMDGDPQGDLKKTKQQLEKRGSSAVELCRTLATRYSKQLFDIYKNKEDPLFLPS